MAKPAITVLLTVYNGQDHAAQAIQSVLDQSFKDFEFIIINDGSTDSSDDIIKNFKDPRIVYILQNNMGLVASLNKGIMLAKAPLIARMDHDDVSDLNRLASQVDFLKNHPEYVLVGGNLEFINESGDKLYDSPLLLNDPELRLEALLRSPFGHPAVMYRKQAVIDAGLYNPEYKSAEDYDMWLRLMRYGKVANLNQTVLKYRIFADDVSTTNKFEQKSNTDIIRNKIWSSKGNLPPVPRFGFSVKHYAAADQTTKIQVGRLADVYTGVFIEALRRGDIRYSMRVALAMCGPSGIWNGAKSLKRRVWSKV